MTENGSCRFCGTPLKEPRALRCANCDRAQVGVAAQLDRAKPFVSMVVVPLLIPFVLLAIGQKYAGTQKANEADRYTRERVLTTLENLNVAAERLVNPCIITDSIKCFEQVDTRLADFVGATAEFQTAIHVANPTLAPVLEVMREGVDEMPFEVRDMWTRGRKQLCVPEALRESASHERAPIDRWRWCLYQLRRAPLISVWAMTRLAEYLRCKYSDADGRTPTCVRITRDLDWLVLDEPKRRADSSNVQRPCVRDIWFALVNEDIPTKAGLKRQASACEMMPMESGSKSP